MDDEFSLDEFSLEVARVDGGNQEKYFKQAYCVRCRCSRTHPKIIRPKYSSSRLQGPFRSFTLRDLEVNQSYELRVRGRSQGAESLSPWSVVAEAYTSLPPHGCK